MIEGGGNTKRSREGPTAQGNQEQKTPSGILEKGTLGLEGQVGTNGCAHCVPGKIKRKKGRFPRELGGGRLTFLRAYTKTGCWWGYYGGVRCCVCRRGGG